MGLLKVSFNETELSCIEGPVVSNCWSRFNHLLDVSLHHFVPLLCQILTHIRIFFHFTVITHWVCACYENEWEWSFSLDELVLLGWSWAARWSKNPRWPGIFVQDSLNKWSNGTHTLRWEQKFCFCWTFWTISASSWHHNEWFTSGYFSCVLKCVVENLVCINTVSVLRWVSLTVFRIVIYNE